MNQSILLNITEEQVGEWMKAKLAEIRQSGLPCHHLSLAVHLHLAGPYLCVNLHALGRCSVAQTTVASAVAQLNAELGNRAQLAAEKRAEAEKLLEEANELEAMVKGRSS